MTQFEQSASALSWREFESAVDRLHAAARTPIGADRFYQQLAEAAATSLSAWEANVSRISTNGAAQLAARWPRNGTQSQDVDPVLRRRCREDAIERRAAVTVPIASNESGEAHLVICPIISPTTAAGEQPSGAAAIATIEVLAPEAAVIEVRDGREQFLQALAQVAQDAWVYRNLRRLRDQASLQERSVAILQRVIAAASAQQAAFEMVNEGRQALECDRLTAVMRRGRRWRVMAVSGVDRVDPRADFSRRAATVAKYAANWGEPIGYRSASDLSDRDDQEMPPQLSDSIESFVDASSARRFACAAFRLAGARGEPAGGASGERSGRDLALLAERFDADGDSDLVGRTYQLGALCAPSVGRIASYDRFPLRWIRRVADATSWVRESLGWG
ncbi:MAG: hypothetical protein AAF961_06690, partial [Planctomycetota bacterium]